MDIISVWSFKSGAEKPFLTGFPESLEQQYLEAGANHCSPGCWDSCGLLSVGSAHRCFLTLEGEHTMEQVQHCSSSFLNHGVKLSEAGVRLCLYALLG